jgi:hypothetical protein
VYLISAFVCVGDELSDEDQVAELLVNFNLHAEGNVSTVNENSQGQTAVISISSQHMRKLYHRFPELLLIDCTHKTYRYGDESSDRPCIHAFDPYALTMYLRCTGHRTMCIGYGFACYYRYNYQL